jgi:hypothetical protein
VIEIGTEIETEIAKEIVTETEIEIEEEEEAPHLQITDQEDAQIPQKEKKEATNTTDPKGGKIKKEKDPYQKTIYLKKRIP